MALLFDSVTLDILAVVSFCAVGLYFYIQHIYSYWDKRNVKSAKSIFPFGSLKDACLLKTSFIELFQDLYNSTNEPVLGIYTTTKPGLLIRDTEILRSILIRDFQYFHDRGVYMDDNLDPLSGHLSSLTGEKWKQMRAKLTPTFSSARIKAMFQTFLDCGKSLETYLAKSANTKEEVEMRDLMACYSTNIIASVAFGLETDSITEPDNTFRIMGRKFTEPSLKNIIRLSCLFILPHIGKMFKVKSVDDDYEAFIFKMVKDIMDYRETNNIQRKDFMQLLLQLKHKGKVGYEDNWDFNPSNDINEVSGEVKKFTLNELAAQAHVFFLAGFETTSSTVSFSFYELAKNPDIQSKVQAEIDSVTKKYDGKITYESLNEMKYLESCIDEVLRMHPPASVLNRECTKEYKLSGTNITLEKGTRLLLPILAIHKDPKHFPEPELFKPERFLTDDWKSGELKYLPFGDGPRVCIALRMGKLQTKIGIALILSKFNVRLGDRLQKEKTFKYDTKSIQPSIEGGLHLKISHRN